MRAEGGRVEAHAGQRGVGRVEQPPAVGGPRHLERHPGVDRVAGQHDLGHPRVGQHEVERARVVVREQAEAVQAALRADRLDEEAGVGLGAAPSVMPNRPGPSGSPTKTGLNGLPVTGDAVQRVEVGLKEVRARTHVGEDDEEVEAAHAGPFEVRVEGAGEGAGGGARQRTR